MRERLTKNTIGIRSSKETEKMGTDVAETGVVAHVIKD
jgi:ammonia channel protein AmtB